VAELRVLVDPYKFDRLLSGLSPFIVVPVRCVIGDHVCLSELDGVNGETGREIRTVACDVYAGMGVRDGYYVIGLHRDPSAWELE